VPPSFQPLWPLVSGFGRDHPAVRFDVFVTDRTVDLIADGVDVAIDVVREGSDARRGRTLARYRHRVVAAPAFLDRHRVRAPDDLADMPVGCFRTRTGAPGVWSLGAEQVRLKPRLATNDYLHLRRAALSGEVVTELPPFLAAGPIREGKLVPVLEAHPMPGREIRAIVPETRWTSPLVRQFLDTCAKMLPVELDLEPA
jgi:DNA-binding transcriptional LysR family regulator